MKKPKGPLESGIKQNSDNDCVPCVAAMVTGRTPEEYIEFVDEHSPFDIGMDQSFKIWLAHNSLYAGAGSTEVFNPEIHTLAGKELDGPTIAVKITLIGRLGHLGVTSERFDDTEHALYWDGHQIWDPNPESDDGRNIWSYDFTYYEPIYGYAEAE